MFGFFAFLGKRMCLATELGIVQCGQLILCCSFIVDFVKMLSDHDYSLERIMLVVSSCLGVGMLGCIINFLCKLFIYERHALRVCLLKTKT
jgi:hypothetical protein